MHKKIKIALLITFLVFFLTAVNIAVFFPALNGIKGFSSSAQAAEPGIKIPELQIKIPTLEGGLGEVRVEKIGGQTFVTIPWIANYIGAIYKFGVIAAATLAAVMIMFGGFMWIIAAGSPERITKAKNYIFGATIGLIIALGSYTALEVINPQLIKPGEIKIPTVSAICKANKEITVSCRCGDEVDVRDEGWCCYQKTGTKGTEQGNDPTDKSRELKWQKEPCEKSGGTMSNDCVLGGGLETSPEPSVTCCNGCTPETTPGIIQGETVYYTICKEPCAGAEVGSRGNFQGIKSIVSGQALDATIENQKLYLYDLVGNQAIAGYISSISDNRIKSEKCKFWQPDFNKYRNEEGCIHTKNSLHYGGRLFQEKLDDEEKKADGRPIPVREGRFYCAFDIVVEDVGAFKRLMKIIDPGKKKYHYYIHEEGDHLHVGVNGVEDCGARY